MFLLLDLYTAKMSSNVYSKKDFSLTGVVGLDTRNTIQIHQPVKEYFFTVLPSNAGE